MSHDYNNSFSSEFSFNPPGSLDNISSILDGGKYDLPYSARGKTDGILDNILNKSSDGTKPPTFLEQLQGYGNTFGSVAEGVGGLMQAWQGMQQLGLQEDAFDFSKKSFNRNIANQAQSYNTQLRDNRAAVMSGMSPAQRAAVGTLESYTANNSVDGSKIR